LIDSVVTTTDSYREIQKTPRADSEMARSLLSGGVLLATHIQRTIAGFWQLIARPIPPFLTEAETTPRGFRIIDFPQTTHDSGLAPS